MRILVQIALMAFPWPMRRRLLTWIFGFNIAPSAKVGFSVILAKAVNMSEGARIGSLTFIKGLSELRMGPYAILGNLNWVTGMPEGHPVHFAKDTDRRPALLIGPHAAITHRHLIDCTDTVEIGEFTTFAGWGSQILTHAIDLKDNRQSSAPVKIGSHSFVGTRCILLKGSALPDRSVLAAGSSLTTRETETDSLYSGVRAERIRTLDTRSGYFTRTTGFVK